MVESLKDKTYPVLAVMVEGGVGDCLIAARFLRDLAAEVEGFVFDVYCASPAAASWIFSALPQWRHCKSLFLFEKLKAHYDAAFSLAHAVNIEVFQKNTKHLDQSPQLKAKNLAAKAQSAPLAHYFNKRPGQDNQFAHIVVAQGLTRQNFFHHLFGVTLNAAPLAISTSAAKLQECGLEEGAYITFHNGYDPNVIVMGNKSTKSYDHFDQVIAALKKQMPQVKMVQVGAQTSTPLAGIDINLLNKTSLKEVAGVIKNALCHVDIESGLVHLAHALGTRSVVVFGPTPLSYFGYPENENIPPQFCGDCWATSETWMAFCPRGLAQPVCTTQPAEFVAERTVSFIGRGRTTSMQA